MVVEPLYSMAIPTINYYKNGNPKRTKWIIVALGNLDPHESINTEVYDTAMSKFELLFPISLVIHHSCSL